MRSGRRARRSRSSSSLSSPPPQPAVAEGLRYGCRRGRGGPGAGGESEVSAPAYPALPRPARGATRPEGTSECHGTRAGAPLRASPGLRPKGVRRRRRGEGAAPEAVFSSLPTDALLSLLSQLLLSLLSRLLSPAATARGVRIVVRGLTKGRLESLRDWTSPRAPFSAPKAPGRESSLPCVIPVVTKLYTCPSPLCKLGPSSGWSRAREWESFLGSQSFLVPVEELAPDP